MPFKVIIVGAGLSGCLLANGLLNNGVKVALYERDAANSKREGYQIRLGEAALNAFRQCLTPDQTNAILSKLGQSEGANLSAPSLYTSTNRLLLDCTTIPSYTKSAAINRVVLRDILAQPIMDSGNAFYGKGFARYEIVSTGIGQERVRVHFTDGSFDECDLLVGADGSKSRVSWADCFKFEDVNQTKGKVPHHRIKELPPQLLRGQIMVFSKRATFYYALYLPPKSDDPRGAKSVLDYDEEAASFFFGVNLPIDEIPYKTFSEIPDNRQLCLDYVKVWAPEYTTMLSMAEKDDVYVIKLRASEKPAKNWRAAYRNAANGEGHPRVWLLGDAIHAMQPTRGQGGNQALLDCADMLPELLRLSAQAESGKPPSKEEIQGACDRYEEKMLPRAFEWVKKSGGSKMLTMNLDGPLGYLVFIVGSIVIPLVTLYYKVLGFWS